MPPGDILKLRNTEQPQQSRVQDNVSALLNPLATRLGATPIMGAPPPPWIRPDIIVASTFAQSAATAAVPLPITAYHSDALGYVHGKVALTSAAGTGGNIVAFFIDKDRRPLDLLPFLMSDGGGNVWDVTIGPTGAFTVISAIGVNGLVTGTFTYLAGA